MRSWLLWECSLTLVLYDEHPPTVERSAAEALQVLGAHDGALIDETYNLLNAWISIVPGNSAYNPPSLIHHA